MLFRSAKEKPVWKPCCNGGTPNWKRSTTIKRRDKEGNDMTEENRTYITHLKVTDVPWHRLTTAYGRGTDFPAHLTVLEQKDL